MKEVRLFITTHKHFYLPYDLIMLICAYKYTNVNLFDTNIMFECKTEEALHCHTEVEVSASNNKKLLKSKRERESDIIYARAGKWTHEEETFATKLMDEFEAGRLPDIPMKQTLRKLLSQKLQCNKMRISKKFGGRCYGKVIRNSFLTVG